MSWKMFWQIVLLIIITAVVFSAVKVGMRQVCGFGFKGKVPSYTTQK